MNGKGRILFKSEYLSSFTERGFLPILEMYCKCLEKQDLKPLDTIGGKSVKQVRDGINTKYFNGVFKPYQMKKCEKITVSSR